jgi:hypothetical protein
MLRLPAHDMLSNPWKNGTGAAKVSRTPSATPRAATQVISAGRPTRATPMTTVETWKSPNRKGEVVLHYMLWGGSGKEGGKLARVCGITILKRYQSLRAL